MPLSEFHEALGRIAACAHAVDAKIQQSYLPGDINQRSRGYQLQFRGTTIDIITDPSTEAGHATSEWRLSNIIQSQTSNEEVKEAYGDATLQENQFESLVVDYTLTQLQQYDAEERANVQQAVNEAAPDCISFVDTVQYPREQDASEYVWDGFVVYRKFFPYDNMSPRDFEAKLTQLRNDYNHMATAAGDATDIFDEAGSATEPAGQDTDEPARGQMFQ